MNFDRVLPVLLLLAACGGGEDTPTPPPTTNIADNGLPVRPPTAERRRPDAVGPGTALGLTRLQLEEADLIDADGGELGEVERVETDPAGTVRSLLVQAEGDPRGDRLVRIGFDGLTVVPDGADWSLRTTLTREQLAALPVVAR